MQKRGRERGGVLEKNFFSYKNTTRKIPTILKDNLYFRYLRNAYSQDRMIFVRSENWEMANSA